MALKYTNVDDLKTYLEELKKTKKVYDETIDNLMDIVKMSAVYWQGLEGNIFRSRLYGLIGSDLKCISSEMNAEIEYLNKFILVLDNAQEQIKSKLNG